MNTRLYTPPMARPRSPKQLDNMNRETSERYISSFILHLRGENKRPATIDHYVGAVRQYCAYAEAEHFPAVGGTRTEHVSAWLSALRDMPTERTGKPYSEASIRNRYLGLRSFFDWLSREGDVKRNPFGSVRERLIKPPEADESPKDVVSEADMVRVFAHLEKAKRWRDAAVIAILYDTGMRAGELAKLRSDSVNLETGVIQVGQVGAPTKGRRPRLAHLSPRGVSMLDRYWRRTKRRAPEFAINGNGGGHAELAGQMTRAGIYGISVRAFAELVPPIQATIGAHDLRHTSASHIAGVMSERDMQQLYGWRSPEMARRYTEQVSQQVAVAAHRVASPLERLPKR